MAYLCEIVGHFDRAYFVHVQLFKVFDDFLRGRYVRQGRARNGRAFLRHCQCARVFIPGMFECAISFRPAKWLNQCEVQPRSFHGFL